MMRDSASLAFPLRGVGAVMRSMETHPLITGRAMGVRIPASRCIKCLLFFQAEDGIRDLTVTGVQTCALPISLRHALDEWLTLDLRDTSTLTRGHRVAKLVVSGGVSGGRLSVVSAGSPMNKREIGRASCRERV